MKTTLHRDGTVTCWDCIRQAWLRRVDRVPDEVLATLGADRPRIMRHFAETRQQRMARWQVARGLGLTHSLQDSRDY